MLPTDYHSIDEYLLNRLAGKDLEDFEKRLQSDPEFAAALAEQKKSVALLNRMADLELKMEIQEVGEKFKKGKKPMLITGRLRPWLIAASIAIVLGVAYWLLQSPNNNHLYEQYYTAYNISLGTRDAADEQALKLAEASAFYQQKNYSQALDIFEAIPTANNAKVQLMQGLCYLETGKHQKAIQTFDQLIEKKDPAFQYHAMWYSAMAALKAENTNSCKDYLQLLVAAQDSNGVFQQAAAKELLKKI